MRLVRPHEFVSVGPFVCLAVDMPEAVDSKPPHTGNCMQRLALPALRIQGVFKAARCRSEIGFLGKKKGYVPARRSRERTADRLHFLFLFLAVSPLSSILFLFLLFSSAFTLRTATLPAIMLTRHCRLRVPCISPLVLSVLEGPVGRPFDGCPASRLGSHYQVTSNLRPGSVLVV